MGFRLGLHIRALVRVALYAVNVSSRVPTANFRVSVQIVFKASLQTLSMCDYQIMIYFKMKVKYLNSWELSKGILPIL